MLQEIVISGFGGQGVLSMGKILAYSGIMENKEVSWFPAYGPEQRGGTANVTVIISDDEIGSPQVRNPTDVIVLNPPALTRYAPLVKPGGWVFFSTINRNAKAFLFAIVGAEHVLQLLPKGTHEYARFIRPSELVGWCRDAGLDATATRGLDYNPITRRYGLSADTSVNYLIACRKAA